MFNFNPVLSEIQSHLSSMSPDAQAAVKMANPSLGGTPQLPARAPLTPDSGPPSGNISMPSFTPLITMPQSAPRLVMGPKPGQEMLTNGEQLHPGTLLGDKAELERQAGRKPALESVYSDITGSSFGQHHPILGKIIGGLAQIPATTLDVAASLPYGGTIARLTPGTTLNNRLETRTIENRIGQEENNAGKEATTAATEAEIPLRQAEAQKAGAEAEIAPQEGQARIAAQTATAAHENAETHNLQNPAPKYEETPQGPMMIHPDGTAQPVTANGQPIGPPQKLTYQTVDAADGPHVYGVDEKGNKVVDLGRHYERPVQPPGVMMIVPNAQGGGTVERLTPGQTVAPGAQTAAGVNAVNTPTMTQRTAAGRAATVVSMAPEVLGRIDAMAPKMGPIEGRWGEFMQGKVGADDPDFAALRSDLLMMSSAVALAHAQGRLPENLREEFDRAINAPKQTASNLKATINTMIPWLTAMQNQGKPGAETQPHGGNSEPKVMKFNPKTGRLE